MRPHPAPTRSQARPRTPVRLACLMAAGLLAASCGPDDRPGAAAGDTLAADAPAPASAPAPRGDPDIPGRHRPATVIGAIEVEGMPQPMTLRLFRTPPGFPLPFSTYLPEDVEPGSVASGEGDAVMFVAAFGGRRNEDARVALQVLPGGTTGDAARAVLRQSAPGGPAAHAVPGAAPAPASATPRRFPWSLDEVAYRFRGRDETAVVGSAALGRRDGRYFILTVQYPEEFGDGFGPRVARILGDWQWADHRRFDEGLER
jgi:hypothetical protein